MRDTITIDQIELLLKNEYGDPHSVLGLHIVSKDGDDFAVVRELIPGAVSIEVYRQGFPTPERGLQPDCSGYDRLLPQ